MHFLAVQDGFQVNQSNLFLTWQPIRKLISKLEDLWLINSKNSSWLLAAGMLLRSVLFQLFVILFNSETRNRPIRVDQSESILRSELTNQNRFWDQSWPIRIDSKDLFMFVSCLYGLCQMGLIPVTFNFGGELIYPEAEESFFCS